MVYEKSVQLALNLSKPAKGGDSYLTLKIYENVEV